MNFRGIERAGRAARQPFRQPSPALDSTTAPSVQFGGDRPTDRPTDRQPQPQPSAATSLPAPPRSCSIVVIVRATGSQWHVVR